MTKREEDGKRMLDFYVTQVHKAYPTKPTTLSHTPATMLGYNSTRITTQLHLPYILVYKSENFRQN